MKLLYMMNHEIIFGCLSSHIYASKFVKICQILFFKKLLAVNLKGRLKKVYNLRFLQFKFVKIKNISLPVTYSEINILLYSF